MNTESVNQLQEYLADHFNLGLVSLIPIVVLVTLLVMKKPALPSIFIASVSGGLVAVLVQGFTFSETTRVLL
jgi:NhaC family Na+:H+ antiporter